mmetsp:Transcript_78835/g.189197  ORF Transcript_78835/g.189197 Transcript_78835/m.189197 type:complete len:555 (-) Transcript_78835:92-1756(-)
MTSPRLGSPIWAPTPPLSSPTRRPAPNWQRYQHRRELNLGERSEATSTPRSTPRRSQSLDFSRTRCPLAMRPDWPRRFILPVWDIENIRSRLRLAAYLGPDPLDRLRRKLDLERTGLLSSEQLRRVVRLKLRVPSCNVSDQELKTLAFMLDFQEHSLVRVDDLASFILADADLLRQTVPEDKTRLSATSTGDMSSRTWESRPSSRSPSPRSVSLGLSPREGSPFRASPGRTMRPDEADIGLGLSRSPSPSRAEMKHGVTLNLPLRPASQLPFEEEVLRSCQMGSLGRLRQLLMSRPLPRYLGGTCAHLAVNQGHTEMVDFLLRAHVDPQCRDQNGASLLSRAAVLGHTEIVKILLGQWRANPLDSDDKGRTAIHLACCSDLRTVQLLANHSPAAVHARDATGRSCFYYALACPHLEEQNRILQYLLYCRCDPDAADDEGHTALWFAAESGNHTAVGLFLNAGADPRLVSALCHHDSTARQRLGPCRCFECTARGGGAHSDATMRPEPGKEEAHGSGALFRMLDTMSTSKLGMTVTLGSPRDMPAAVVRDMQMTY